MIMVPVICTLFLALAAMAIHGKGAGKEQHQACGWSHKVSVGEQHVHKQMTTSNHDAIMKDASYSRSLFTPMLLATTSYCLLRSSAMEILLSLLGLEPQRTACLWKMVCQQGLRDEEVGEVVVQECQVERSWG